MRSIGASIVIMLSMFTRIPLPMVDWNKKNMRYVMAALPVAGLVTGLVVYGGWRLMVLLEWPQMMQAGLLAIVPLLVTGGIHMDGFCDTTDALASHGSKEQKLEILKDPNAGAFAVIGAIVYMLAYASFWAMGFAQAAVVCFCLSFITARVLGGLATATFPLAKNTGLAHTFADGAARRTTIVVLVAVGCAAGVALLWVSPAYGAGILITQLLVFAALRWRLAPQFGGITGDLVGWLIQMAELGALGSMAVVSSLLAGR